MTIDIKIKDKKQTYDVKREGVKMSALLSGKV